MIISIIVIIAAVILAWVVYGYNRLIRLTNKTGEAWADIDVQLKRRYDLIPNLVNAVKGYASHEQATFDSLANARSAAMGAGSPGAKGQAEATLAGALHSVIAIAEAYPELKANQNFLDLQVQLTDTEDKLQMARRYYNGNVRDINTTIQTFPGNIVASLFHFLPKEFFQLDSDAAREPVNVSI